MHALHHQLQHRRLGPRLCLLVVLDCARFLFHILFLSINHKLRRGCACVCSSDLCLVLRMLRPVALLVTSFIFFVLLGLLSGLLGLLVFFFFGLLVREVARILCISSRIRSCG